MATLADSLISSSSRAVKLRMRPDLSARQHRYHGRCFWVLKAPVGLNYFRFHEEEYAILQMLDGETSLEVVQTEVYRKEGSEWQLVHRHADPLVHRSTLQKAATLSRGERENE